jgi:hypothetical protein
MHGLTRVVGGGRRNQVDTTKSIFKPIESIQTGWHDHVKDVVMQNLKQPQIGHMRELAVGKRDMNRHFAAIGKNADGVVSLHGQALPFTAKKSTEIKPENVTGPTSGKESTHNLSSATWSSVKTAATTLKDESSIPDKNTQVYVPTQKKSMAPGPPTRILDNLPAPKRPEPPASFPPSALGVDATRVVQGSDAKNVPYPAFAQAVKGGVPITRQMEVPTVVDLVSPTATLSPEELERRRKEKAAKEQAQRAMAALATTINRATTATRATGSGAPKPRRVRRIGLAEAKRLAAIKHLVKERGMKLGEASAYIKKNGIPSDLVLPEVQTRTMEEVARRPSAPASMEGQGAPAQKAKRVRSAAQQQRDAKMRHLMTAKKMKMAEAAAYLKANPQMTV